MYTRVKSYVPWINNEIAKRDLSYQKPTQIKALTTETTTEKSLKLLSVKPLSVKPLSVKPLSVKPLKLLSVSLQAESSVVLNPGLISSDLSCLPSQKSVMGRIVGGSEAARKTWRWIVGWQMISRSPNFDFCDKD